MFRRLHPRVWTKQAEPKLTATHQHFSRWSNLFKDENSPFFPCCCVNVISILCEQPTKSQRRTRRVPWPPPTASPRERDSTTRWERVSEQSPSLLLVMENSWCHPSSGRDDSSAFTRANTGTKKVTASNSQRWQIFGKRDVFRKMDFSRRGNLKRCSQEWQRCPLCF